MDTSPAPKRPKLSSQGLSSFELLPKELAWKILEYAPESAFRLRLTSRTVQDRVDEHALLPTNKVLVLDLKFAGPGGPPPQTLRRIEIFVHEDNVNEFDLRLIVRLRSFPRTNPFKRAKPANDDYVMVYSYELDHKFLNDDTLELFKSMGKRIRELDIDDCVDTSSLACISKIINEVQIGNLEIEVYSHPLTDDIANFIVETLQAKQINLLSIAVYKVHGIVPDIDRTKNYLLGIYDADWSKIILDLFSKKVDKITIKNFAYPEYLSLETATALREKLPEIEKKVWFKAACNKFPYEINATRENYTTTAARSDTHMAWLRIKHNTRVHEFFDPTSHLPFLEYN